jgi:hypothetical protein
MAVDTLGHLLALHVTPASAEDRGEVQRLTRTVQVAPKNASRKDKKKVAKATLVYLRRGCLKGSLQLSHLVDSRECKYG